MWKKSSLEKLAIVPLIWSLDFIDFYFPKIPGRVTWCQVKDFTIIWLKLSVSPPIMTTKTPLKGKFQNSDAFSTGTDPDHGRSHFPAIPCRRWNDGYRFSVLQKWIFFVEKDYESEIKKIKENSGKGVKWTRSFEGWKAKRRLERKD